MSEKIEKEVKRTLKDNFFKNTILLFIAIILFSVTIIFILGDYSSRTDFINKNNESSSFLALNHQKKILKINDIELNVHVSDTNEKRLRGLSGQEKMSLKEGMFFVHENSGIYGIWMKEMLFSLDILWINEDFFIVHIEKNVPPDTFPKVFYPQNNAKYILEVNAGFSDYFDVKVGDRVVIQ